MSGGSHEESKNTPATVTAYGAAPQHDTFDSQQVGTRSRAAKCNDLKPRTEGRMAWGCYPTTPLDARRMSLFYAGGYYTSATESSEVLHSGLLGDSWASPLVILITIFSYTAHLPPSRPHQYRKINGARPLLLVLAILLFIPSVQGADEHQDVDVEFIGEPRNMGPIADFITLATANAQGHLMASASELFQHGADKAYDIMCVVETGSNFHLLNSRTWRYANGLKQFSTHAMGPPAPNHKTGGIAFCLSPRMAPFFSKMVTHPQDRFCALHLNCKRGVEMVLIGAHAHPSPLKLDTRPMARDMRAKISAYIRTNRRLGNKIFLMGDLNCYPTDDLDKFVNGPGLPSKYKPCFQDMVDDNFMVDTFRHRCWSEIPASFSLWKVTHWAGSRESRWARRV